MRWLFGILLIIGGSIGAYFALDAVLWQDRAVRFFVPTDARVISSQVVVHRGKSTSYSPAVTYSYAFQGQSYQSSRVIPFSEQGSFTWADGIVRRFPPRAKVTAFVNPAAAQESVLVQVYSSLPYLLSYVAIFAAAVGVGLLIGVLGSGRSVMMAIPLDGGGWQLLLPGKSLRRRLREAFIALVISGVPVGIIGGHYVVVARPFDVLGWILIVVASALVIVEMVLVLRAWSLTRHVSDARLQINPAPMKLGEPLLIRAELDAYSALRVTAFQARVVCVEHYKEQQGNKTVYGTRTRVEKGAQLARESSVAAGQIVGGEGEVLFDAASAPPSCDPLAAKTHPYFTWEIRLELELAGMVNYRAAFPLTAGAADTPTLARQRI